jgi:hypothetical protein
MRLVDVLPGVAPTMILVTAKHQRLGDLVAGTVVSYCSRPPSAPSALRPLELGAPRGIDLQPITEHELALVRRFLLRRPTLTTAARASIGKRLANRLRDRLPALEGMAPEEFLEAVAVEAGHRASTRRDA